MDEGDDRLGLKPQGQANADGALRQLMAIWRYGEAARRDPVLLNMQARIAGELRYLAPGEIERGRALFDRLMTEQVGVGGEPDYRG